MLQNNSLTEVVNCSTLSRSFTFSHPTVTAEASMLIHFESIYGKWLFDLPLSPDINDVSSHVECKHHDDDEHKTIILRWIFEETWNAGKTNKQTNELIIKVCFSIRLIIFPPPTIVLPVNQITVKCKPHLPRLSSLSFYFKNSILSSQKCSRLILNWICYQKENVYIYKTITSRAYTRQTKSEYLMPRRRRAM